MNFCIIMKQTIWQLEAQEYAFHRKVMLRYSEIASTAAIRKRCAKCLGNGCHCQCRVSVGV